MSLIREFKGVWIPKEIYLNSLLSRLEKDLLVEIISLDNEKGCFASNAYLATFLDTSEITVSNSIKKLKELAYIYQESFDGRTRILHANPDVYLKAELRDFKVQDPIKNSDELKDSLKVHFKADLKPTLRQTQSILKSSIKVGFKDNNIENNIENNKVEIPELRSETEKIDLLSSVLKNSEKEEIKSKKISKKLIEPEALRVLTFFKTNVSKFCNASTPSIVAGIPRAITIFQEYFKDDAVEKLIEALYKFRQDGLYTWMLNNCPSSISPKTIFSEKFVKDKLLPFTINQTNHGTDVLRPKTEEELRQIQESNKANFDKFMARHSK